MRRRTLILAAMMAVATVRPDAHHSISTVYDRTRQVTVAGVVREFRFVNPHPWLGIDVTDANGRTQPWRLEMDNRFELVDVGVTADTLRPGDRVVATGSAGRDGSRSLYLLRLDRPDGFRYEQVGPSPRVQFPK